MANEETPTTIHRHNGDGSYDSICLACFRTIATVEKESFLAPKEEFHVCEKISQEAVFRAKIYTLMTSNMVDMKDASWRSANRIIRYPAIKNTPSRISIMRSRTKKSA
jgi:hypothetical protein